MLLKSGLRFLLAFPLLPLLGLELPPTSQSRLFVERGEFQRRVDRSSCKKKRLFIFLSFLYRML
ncbi:hypothetical protein AAHE18_04G110800 [Arachis hypogaea]